MVGPTRSDPSSDSAWKLCVRGTFLDFVDPAADPDATQARCRRSSDPGLHSGWPSFFAAEEGYVKQLQEKMNGQGGASATEEFARPSTGVPSPTSPRSTGSSEGGAGPPDAPLSSGSVGHPALCRPPCRDAAACRASCSFCHLPHESHRQNALDKSNRRTLRLVGRRAMVEVLLHVVRAKVAELCLGEGAARALEEWQADVGAAPPAQADVEECSTVTPRELRRLRQFLKTLYLNDLCFLPGPLDVRSASTRLMDRLRDLRAAA